MNCTDDEWASALAKADGDVMGSCGLEASAGLDEAKACAATIGIENESAALANFHHIWGSVTENNFIALHNADPAGCPTEVSNNFRHAGRCAQAKYRRGTLQDRHVNKPTE